MLRKILIVAISFAIIFAGYLFYSIFFSVTIEEERLSGLAPVALLPETVGPRSIPDEPLPPEEAVLSSPGKKAYFERYSKGRLLYQFRAERWEPAEKKGEFRLFSPELRIFLKGGQTVDISADRGLVVAKRIADSKIEPIYGELAGTVHIYVDRRAAASSSQPAELRPEDIIHIWLDKVVFNLELNTIESSEAITLESYDADLSGRGLFIRWDGIEGKLEVLRILEGDKLTIYRAWDLAGTDLSSGKTGKTEGSARINLSTNTSEQGSYRHNEYEDKHGERHREHKEANSSQRDKNRSFILTFGSDVLVKQLDKTRLLGKMQCDKLNVIFDLPEGYEKTAGYGQTGEDEKVKNATKAQEEEKKGSFRKQPFSKDDQPRLEITWKGPLEIKPLEDSSPTMRRFHIIAYGTPVKIDHSEGITVRCRKLVYEEERDFLLLEGTEEDPVQITEDSARKIVGVRLTYDERQGVISGFGPGFMEQSAEKLASISSQPEDPSGRLVDEDLKLYSEDVKLFWQKGFTLRVGSYLYSPGVYKRYLKSAHFEGNVQLIQPDRMVKAENIELTFKRPQPYESPLSGIDQLYAEGKVLLQERDQSIEAGKLDIRFGYQRRIIPRQVHAEGSVFVRDGDRFIAAEKLYATFTAVDKGSSARDGTTDKGINEDILIRLKEFTAEGNVIVDSIADSTYIKAERLDARVNYNNELEYCRIEAKEGQVEASFEDFTIYAGRVEAYPIEEKASSDTAGRLVLISREDLDGRRLEDPLTVEVDWSGFMRLVGGEKNRGIFTGNVKVRSKNTTLYADRLIIDFEDAPGAKGIDIARRDDYKDKATAVGGKAEGSISQDNVKRRKGRDDITAEAVRVPLIQKRLTYIHAQPQHATDKVYIQSLERDQSGVLINRVTLRADSITVDLITRRMDVPGEGELLIEDYRLPKEDPLTSKSSYSNSAVGPLGADISFSSPSQSLFRWKTGLLYLIDRRIAILDGNVTFLHVSGPAVLGEVLAREDLKARGPARRVELRCDNLKVEFLRGVFGPRSEENVGIAELKKVVASGAVHLSESTRSIIASKLLYDRLENIIVIEGSSKEPAYLYEESPESIVTYSGPVIVWDRSLSKILAPGASITTELK